jgi:hypothetical protein
MGMVLVFILDPFPVACVVLLSVKKIQEAFWEDGFLFRDVSLKRFKKTMRIEIAAGVMPDIRDAWPRDEG